MSDRRWTDDPFGRIGVGLDGSEPYDDGYNDMCRSAAAQFRASRGLYKAVQFRVFNDREHESIRRIMERYPDVPFVFHTLMEGGES